MALSSINPSSGEVLESFEEATPAALERVLAHAWEACLGWRARSFAERAAHLREVARALGAKKVEYARLMALEMGKPVTEGEAEVEKCAWGCEYYAEHAARFLAPEPRETDAARSYVRFDALGPVLAIMPWNFPFWQVFRFAAPALMAGNAGILKHASNVPRCALEIERVFRAAGLPEGLFGTVLVGPAAVPALIAHARIRAVTLGGSDPFIVLEDADLARAARTAAAARLVNSGQSCIAAKRFIVVEKVVERFLELFVGEMRARRMGDPLARDTEVGPQARADLRDVLHRQVEESVKRGARLLLGGSVPPGPGAFYPPTVLTAVDKGMPAFDEETFGPVAAVVRARDEDDAIRLANDSAFGLGASLWTASRERAERLAAAIEAGSVFVNGLVKSDPRLPFGGIKRSGYGRELSEFGIREFVNVKSVWMA